ncbi:MAG: glycosyltransferase, partial [Anaerolineales bacterium]|nr:glycosyltransferase [Anaerolineales bacterium]
AHFLRRAVAFGAYVLEHIAQQPAYDVVHVRSIWSGFPLAQVKSEYGFKLLYEVNGLPSIEMKYHYPGLVGSQNNDDGDIVARPSLLDKLKEQEIATLHAADAIVTPSQVTAAYITSLRVAADKITVIPNGFDEEQFGKSDEWPSEREQSPMPVILYVGTLADWQGLDVLLHALALVAAERPCQLRIVGRGRKRQRKLLLKQAR